MEVTEALSCPRKQVRPCDVVPVPQDRRRGGGCMSEHSVRTWAQVQGGLSVDE